MTTDSLLDQTRKFVVLGPDEKIWIFAYEPESKVTDMVVEYFWMAYSMKPGAVFMPEGPWDEGAVFRFLNKHGSHRLDDEDKVDLLFFLHLGGIEAFFKKNRSKEKK